MQPLPKQIDRYVVQGQLGQGGMSVVYRSFHPLLNRPVAVKVMLPTADASQHERFLREARAMAALSHPGIINIFDVALDMNQPYIVMELIDGGSLADQLIGSALDFDKTEAVLLALCDALGYAHSQGVIHRDLKPANVLLRADGTPVLADFGLARTLNSADMVKVTQSGGILGTPAYMAPEQFTSAPCDARTDIYALGVLLFELLTGRLPFIGDMGHLIYAHLQQPPPDPRAFNPLIPEPLALLTQRMMAKEPSARPQSTAEVRAALKAMRSSTPVTIPVQRTYRTSTFGAMLVGVVFLLAVGAFWLRAARVDNVSSQQVQVATSISVNQPPTHTTTSSSIQPAPDDTLERVEVPMLAFAEPAEPESFTIAGLTSGVLSNGTLFFCGEVRNDGDAPREDVEVQINLFDQSGAEIASDRRQVQLRYLNPGEVASFLVLFSDTPWLTYQRYQLQVRSDPAEFQLQYTLRGFAITEVAYTPDEFSDALSGQVQNNSGEAARFVEVLVTLYDREGRVVGVSQQYADISNEVPLEPGATTTFGGYVGILLGEPAAYRLQVQGSRP